MKKRDTKETKKQARKRDMRFAEVPGKNPDPITGASGAHPVGTGAGAASGAAAGAAIGTVFGGPVGFAVGGAAGAVVGGLAGKGVAEAVNPTVEDEYWREHYASRPYAISGASYESLQPAYRYGWESRSRLDGREWTDVEADLASGWEKARGNSRLDWEAAKPAARDAWDRLSRENERMDDDGATRDIPPIPSTKKKWDVPRR